MNADRIVAAAAERFRCFGRGSKSNVMGNPLAEALKDAPPQFAAGVDVREVVLFVIEQMGAAP